MSGRKQRREAQLALADFQRGAVDALREAIGATARAIANRPKARRSIALAQGVSLLQAPTGSGKTLMLGRVLEGLAGGLPEKTVWFWFAPYSGLVRQTGDALNAHCRRLRQRDVYTDRDPAQARDGDIFIQTWAAVAARNKDARKTRRDREDMLSLDTMLEELRDRGFFVGVVVDEAHLNFGTSAKAAAAFYLETLRPDFTLLATATPHDDKLAAFEAAAGIGETNRVIVDRDSVVAAGLNKAGIVLGYLRVPEKKQALVDIEQATLQAAWDHHRRIAARLEERNVGLTPLMLVQVEDQAAGGDDPVDRAREMLLEFGVPKQAIAVHTSGEPDPYFHTLAFDPEKQVLIFKVAVATGFDAPRAWTLVSLRPNRGKEFGLQIVGRIMRVHPLLRPLHGDDALLDRGYVFLSDPEMQGGLQQAADELRAVRQGIELVTDRVDVFEVSPDSRDAAGLAEADAQAVFTAAPSEAAALRARVAAFVQQERLPAATLDYAPEEQARMLNAADTSRAFERSIASTLDMFTGAPDAAAPAIGPARRGTKRKTDGLVAYALQESLGLPHALRREMLPAPEEIEGLVAEMARAVPIDAEIKTYLLEKRVPAELHKLEVFRRELERETVKVEVSNARVAERAQRAFQFNESIDPRDLKRALVQRLRTICEEEGIDYAERDLRRTIDLIGLRRPGHLYRALNETLMRETRVSQDEPIPAKLYGPSGLTPARKGAYGVFPHNMKREERAFAEWLDADDTGTVKWWLRNPESERWAVRLILPNGRRHFPDFVVGVAGRRSEDEAALVEVKDDGSTGRLHADVNLLKIRTRHQDYGSVLWVCRDTDGETWLKASLNPSINKIVLDKRLEVRDLLYSN